MAKEIIIRAEGGKVAFETVSIDVTQTVFFRNQTPQPHVLVFPQKARPPSQPVSVGAFKDGGPVASSAQFNVPVPQSGATPPKDLDLPYSLSYQCSTHPHEQPGVISVYAVLEAVFYEGEDGGKLGAGTMEDPYQLNDATRGEPTDRQRVARGGKSDYRVSREYWRIPGADDFAPGAIADFQLKSQPGNAGVAITGAPRKIGTYTFTFRVDDAMGTILQGTYYTIDVSEKDE